MNTLSTGVAATLAARVWMALLGLLFVPIQIHYLGLEAFGLLGFLLSLQTLLAVVDFGLSYSLVRKLATEREPESAARRRDIIRTFELFYWGVALAVAAVLFAFAPWIPRWLNAAQMSEQVLIDAFRLFALVMLLQLPTAIYAAGLAGLERQVTLNAVNAGAATLRVGGGLLVLALVSAQVGTLLAWFALAAGLGTLAMRQALRGAAGGQARGGAFDGALLRANFRYAFGVSGILVLTTVLTQLDRLILGRVVSLEALGAYTVAASVCTALLYLPGVVTAPFFPRFSAVAAAGDADALRRVYHLGSQAISVLVLPAALMLSAFAPEVLQLWIRDPAVASHATPILRLLVLATGIGSLTALPFTLQAALGRNRVVLLQYLALLAAAVPLLAAAGSYAGAPGIALAWLALYLVQVAVVTPLVHRQSLGGEHGAWLLHDLLAPLAAAAATVAIFRLALPTDLSAPWLVLWLLLGGAASICAALLASSMLCGEALLRLRALRRAPR